MSSAITVGELLERAELEVTAVAGQPGLARIVTVPRIQKPGLALTGWHEQLHPHRVLVLGGTEIEYLADHPPARVLGIGVLLLGKSGIGKSETALDLVVRGHRLVADDVIKIRRQGAYVVGRGAGIIGHHMEIRGLGIINIKDLFGISAVRDTKKIELVVELREWNEHEEYDRLGFDDRFDRILDVAVAAVQLPVRPGRNLATLIEVAARNQLLKLQGTHSARAFRDQLHRAMEATSEAMAEATADVPMDAVE